MPRRIPIFYSAMLLTGVNLLLRLAGTSFQVYISAKIGAAGIGLLQLVMSVGSFAMIAGMAGVRTATMYLTAEELGKDRRENVTWVLSGCVQYSVLCSGSIAVLLYIMAPYIAVGWIGDIRTAEALRLFAAFLPVVCLCGVMTGYFTAAGRIGVLAVVEIAEQLISMCVTIAALHLWAKSNASRACQCIILGSSIASCITLMTLVLLRLREQESCGEKIPLGNRLFHTAVPLAAADLIKSGINTVENLMVPKRLALNQAVVDPLAAFGVTSGMVFPILMFPACVLYGLAELLVPELSRCSAAGSRDRISYLTRRTLKTAMLYGSFFSGCMFLLGDVLCVRLYNNLEAGGYLKLYSLLVPVLYCDAVTDAMTKGLGQQKICVRYNILTSALDVALLYAVLPVCGMKGYFLSFAVTHIANFMLSLRRLLRISSVKIPFYIPALTCASLAAGIFAASYVQESILRLVIFSGVTVSSLVLFQIINREDIRWLRGLLKL